MTPIESDKIKIKTSIDMLYISPQHLENIEATECEVEIRAKLESFKSWANNLLDQKLK